MKLRVQRAEINGDSISTILARGLYRLSNYQHVLAADVIKPRFLEGAADSLRSREHENVPAAHRQKCQNLKNDSIEHAMAEQSNPRFPSSSNASGNAMSWAVVAQRLVVIDAEGCLHDYTATALFSSYFNSVSLEPHAPPLDDAAANLGLQFERFPCDLAVSAVPVTDGSARLAIRRQLMLPDGSKVECTAEAVAAGHAVVDQRWYTINPTHLEQLGSLLQAAGVDGVKPMTMRQYMQMRLAAESNGILRHEPAWLSPPDSALPEVDLQDATHLNAILYPYQRTGARWLATLAKQELGGILADEMGLGKTIQLIAQIAALAAKGEGSTLVVGTTSILENWRRELNRFAPQLAVLVHEGPLRTGIPQGLQGYNAVLVSYDTFIRDAVMLRQLEWSLVVVDEAQFAKNPDTLRAQCLRTLRTKQIIASTGTPIENSLQDLWSLVDLVVPGLLGSKTQFRARYPDDLAAAAHLSAVTAPIILRRRVRDVAMDLPERIDVPTALRLSDVEAAGYEQIRSEAQHQHSAEMLALLTRLRQYCTHPILCDRLAEDLTLRSVKYNRFLEIMAELIAREEKALVFVSFQRMLDLMSVDLRTRFGVFSEVIDGRTLPRLRQPVIDDFSSIPGAAVLCLNPRAAGVGLNIAAANHVIHYTLEWNPAVEDQASARAYRRGQTRPVTVHRLFYSDTVEEYINTRLSQKRELSSHGLSKASTEEVDVSDLLRALSLSPTRASQ